jgi:gamma-glutamylcyclotransferase
LAGVGKTDLYFAYGSNLDARQMRERCPSSLPLCRARLPDHALDFTYYSTRWSGGAADVVPSSEALVWGVVYQLDTHEIALLDRYELGYDRIPLEVIDDRARVHKVLSYTVREKGRFPPSDIYLQKLLTWGQRWRFPAEYLGRLTRR